MSRRPPPQQIIRVPSDPRRFPANGDWYLTSGDEEAMSRLDQRHYDTREYMGKRIRHTPSFVSSRSYDNYRRSHHGDGSSLVPAPGYGPGYGPFGRRHEGPGDHRPAAYSDAGGYPGGGYFSEEQSRDGSETDPRRPRPHTSNGPGRKGSKNGFHPEVNNNGGLPEEGGFYKKFEVEHLVTWTVGSAQGVLTPEDGLRQMRILERQSGIWTLRCGLVISSTHLIVMDGHTGEEREHFPLQLVENPIPFTNRDRGEVYGNVLVFTVADESSGSGATEMHIFQVARRPAREIASEILEMKRKLNKDKGRKSSDARPRISHTEVLPHENHHPKNGEIPFRTRENQMRVQRPSSGEPNETVERDVTLLNRCFNDIEGFCARLQQSSEALKKLDGRRKSKSDRRYGDGMLTMRARAPPPSDFFAIFQKFKFSFNLLARLRAHIHDPNAPELVHFLFTPLVLILDASKDPRYGSPEVASKVVTPLLTSEAKELLNNCLSSKEMDLWQSLGDTWTFSRAEWPTEYLAPYNPRFSDGWEPPAQWLEGLNEETTEARNRRDAKQLAREASKASSSSQYTKQAAGTAYSDIENGQYRQTPQTPLTPSPAAITSAPQAPPFNRPGPSHGQLSQPLSARSYQAQADVHTPERAKQQNGFSDGGRKAFIRELLSRAALIYEVINDRTGNNDKELTVRRGDIVEVLDSSRNWWSAKNKHGVAGFVPYTILTQYEATPSDTATDRTDHRHQSPASPPQAPPPPLVLPHAQHQPPPPPPPPPLAAGINNNGRQNWKSKSAGTPRSQEDEVKVREKKDVMRRNQLSFDFNSELQTRLQSQKRPASLGLKRFSPRIGSAPVTVLDKRSSAYDVTQFLLYKGFEEMTVSLFDGYTGADMFKLTSAQLGPSLPHEEATRLESQLTLQKKLSGYNTMGSSELNAILRTRKQQSESDTPTPPGHAFSLSPFPDPPDFGESNSNGSNNAFSQYLDKDFSGQADFNHQDY